MMKRQRGFTLIELVVAMVILVAMLALLYSGLNFAARGWDAGAANGQRMADRRIGENFLRRELSELFPMRWKDPMTLRFAFEGEKDHMRFVSSRPAGISQGGLSLVGIEVQDAGGGSRARNLVMLRAMPDDDQKDFRPLEAAKPIVLIADVDSVSFEYFGAESDFATPAWTDSWKWPNRMPEIVRIHMRGTDGAMPEMEMRINLGEEAGCLENAFQRNCRPRRT